MLSLLNFLVQSLVLFQLSYRIVSRCMEEGDWLILCDLMTKERTLGPGVSLVSSGFSYLPSLACFVATCPIAFHDV